MTTTLMLLFASTSQMFELPNGLLSSLCFVESRHKVNAISFNDGESDSIGACQVKLKTAKWLGFKGTAAMLRNPITNVHYAGKYLKYQLTRYHGNIKKAVAAYNAGRYREDAAGAIKNYKYVAKVFTAWNEGR